MEISRHQRRIFLIQAIFLWEDMSHRRASIRLNKTEQEETLNYVWENANETIHEASVTDFDRERFFGVIENLSAIQDLMRTYAPDWPIDRIASHDRAVLYLSIYELLYSDVPAAVVMNEAVELAKEFGGDRSSKFINGVLSSIYKSHPKLNKPTS